MVSVAKKGLNTHIKAVCAALCCALLFTLTGACRQEEDASGPRIEKIEFAENKKNVYVGDVATVTLHVSPESARSSASNKIEYKVSEEGIIIIKPESTSSGVVFEALKRGEVIVTAKAGGFQDYCQITVQGSDANIVPHIIVPDYVVVMEKNQRRNLTATLAGGTPLDDPGFTWVKDNDRSISLTTSGKVGVIDSLDIGETVVTINHAKSMYSINVLVYVLGSDEKSVYITTDQNVVNMNKGDAAIPYMVSLHGGTDTENEYGYTHRVIDGADVIQLVASNNNKGNITALKRGVAKIGVRHPKALHELEIVVIVSEKVEYKYIDVSKTVVILNEGQREAVNFDVVGNVPENYRDKFTFEPETGNDSIDITYSANTMYVSARRPGNTVIKIKNAYIDFAREVLVVVEQATRMIDGANYIITNQNVITMEAGDTAELMMKLYSGVEADRNNFRWTVSDSTVINVAQQDGSVSYTDIDYLSRAAVKYVSYETETRALITAKKVGTATIRLENDKANPYTVIVKVYKKGTFGETPVVLSGSPFVILDEGQESIYNARIAAGNMRDLTALQWEIVDPEAGVAAIKEFSGVNAVLQGNRRGVTTVKISGAGLVDPFTFLVIVGDSDYLQTLPYIYVQNPIVSILKDQQFMFDIMGNCVDGAVLGALTVTNLNPDVIEVLHHGSKVSVRGLQEDRKAKIVISGKDAQNRDLNTLEVSVNVESPDVNPDKPYYLRAQKDIYPVAVGAREDITVELVGSTYLSSRSVIWRSRNSNIVRVEGTGTTGTLVGVSAGTTAVEIEHPNSKNMLVLVVYVGESGGLANMKVLYIEEETLLMRQGDSKYLSVVTNLSPAERLSIIWAESPAGVIERELNSDRTKAVIKAAGIGNTVLTAKYGDSFASVYISVIDRSFQGEYINVPSIIEAVVGDNIVVSAVAQNVYDSYAIEWAIDEAGKNIADLSPNGINCVLHVTQKGSAVISVQHKRLGFSKNVLLFAYDSAAQMVESYTVASDQSRFIVQKGDSVTANLVFGAKGYPANELMNIHWYTDPNENFVEVPAGGNGKSALIKALNVGIGKVYVRGNAGNIKDKPVEIEVEVVEQLAVENKYYFSIDTQNQIIPLVVGGDSQTPYYRDVPIKVFNANNQQINNLSGIRWEIENDSVVKVADNSTSSGLVYRVMANLAGQSFVTFKHDRVEDMRILVYTANSTNELNNKFPLTADTTNFLIKKNETKVIKINTPNDNYEKLQGISYHLTRDNRTVSFTQSPNNKEINVTALNTGTEIIDVRYNGESQLKLYVSVTVTDYESIGSYMMSEQVVAIYMDENDPEKQFETKVMTNVTGGIFWQSDDPLTVEVAEDESYGKTAKLIARSVGETYVTVTGGGIERKVLVVVCSTKAQADEIDRVNIDQRYFRVRKNASQTINVFSNKGKVSGATVFSDMYALDPAYGKVIEEESRTNSRINIVGKNEGIAAIVVKNEYYNFEITVYVEVYNDGSVGVTSNDFDAYIIAEKTVYILNPGEKNVYVAVNVSSSNFRGMNSWRWSGYDPDIISVADNGYYALVSAVPGVQGGRTELIVSNPYTAKPGYIKLLVVIGERYTVEEITTPYIYTEKNMYEAEAGLPYVDVFFDLRNTASSDYSMLQVDIKDKTVSPSYSRENNRLRFALKELGITRIDLSYLGLKTDIYIVHKDSGKYENTYLTTTENYTVLAVNEMKTVTASLVGYRELDAAKFLWVSSDPSVVQVIGNGENGQLIGLKTGEAVVNVAHSNNYITPYPLSIHVKVTANAVSEKAVYLTTQQNVIETVISNTMNYIQVSKIGGDPAKSTTVWTVNDPSVISLSATGYTGMFSAKKAGVVQVTIKNEECRYDLNVVVIVKNPLNNGRYIQTPQSLIVLMPNMNEEVVKASLFGGEESDNNKFAWTVYTQNVTDSRKALAGEQVISISGSNNECRIRGLNEGTATVRVYHEAAELPLYITVRVTQYDKIAFGASSLTVQKGESSYAALNIPAYEYLNDYVKVYSDNTGVCDVFYINGAMFVIGKNVGTATVRGRIEGKEGEAQVLVNVREEHDPDVTRVVVDKQYITMTDKDAPVVIEGRLYGKNRHDSDSDRIQWKMSVADWDAKTVSVFPMMGPVYEIDSSGGIMYERDSAGNLIYEVGPGGEYLKDGAGMNIPKKKIKEYVVQARNIQVSPTGVGQMSFTVTHELVADPSYNKTVIVNTRAFDGSFKITPNNRENRIWDAANGIYLDAALKLNRSPAKITAFIEGGTTRDYAEIIWTVKRRIEWDGTSYECVRIMGTGREVMINPIADGSAEIVAVYRGKMDSCNVLVEGDFFFKFATGADRIFPGITRRYQYDIKPSNTKPNFTALQMGIGGQASTVVTDPNQGIINVSAKPYQPAVPQVGSPGDPDFQEAKPAVAAQPARKYVEITGISEGTATIVGLANSQLAQLQITVAYDYWFSITPLIDSTLPEYTGFPVIGDLSKPNGRKKALMYTVYPYTSSLKAIYGAGGQEDGYYISITAPVRPIDPNTGEPMDIGRGYIIFEGYKEVKDNLKFRQFKPAVNQNTDAQPADPTFKEDRDVTVAFWYSASDAKPVLYFKKYDGAWSKPYNDIVSPIHQDMLIEAYREQQADVISEDKRFFLQKGTASKEDYRFRDDEMTHKMIYDDERAAYYLTIGDGEHHFLMVENSIPGAVMDIKSITVKTAGEPDQEITLNKKSSPKPNAPYTIVYQEADTQNSGSNDDKIIGIHAGYYKGNNFREDEDYIEYTRMKTECDLLLDVSSPYSGSNIGRYQSQNLRSIVYAQSVVVQSAYDIDLRSTAPSFSYIPFDNVFDNITIIGVGTVRVIEGSQRISQGYGQEDIYYTTYSYSSVSTFLSRSGVFQYTANDLEGLHNNGSNVMALGLSNIRDEMIRLDSDYPSVGGYVYHRRYTWKRPAGDVRNYVIYDQREVNRYLGGSDNFYRPASYISNEITNYNTLGLISKDDIYGKNAEFRRVHNNHREGNIYAGVSLGFNYNRFANMTPSSQTSRYNVTKTYNNKNYGEYETPDTTGPQLLPRNFERGNSGYGGKEYAYYVDSSFLADNKDIKKVYYKNIQLPNYLDGEGFVNDHSSMNSENSYMNYVVLFDSDNDYNVNTRAIASDYSITTSTTNVSGYFSNNTLSKILNNETTNYRMKMSYLIGGIKYYPVTSYSVSNNDSYYVQNKRTWRYTGTEKILPINVLDFFPITVRKGDGNIITKVDFDRDDITTPMPTTDTSKFIFGYNSVGTPITEKESEIIITYETYPFGYFPNRQQGDFDNKKTIVIKVKYEMRKSHRNYYDDDHEIPQERNWSNLEQKDQKVLSWVQR